MTRSLPIVLGLSAAMAVAAEPPGAEKEARALVERYFAAYAAKDLDGLMALWSDRAPDYKGRKQAMQRIFAQTGDIKLKELTVVRAEAKGDAARVRVRVELAGADRRTGKQHPDLGKLNRVLTLKKGEGGWKVWRYGPAEQELLDRLLAARDREARRRLYEADGDLLTFDLVNAANEGCTQREERGQYAEAVRLSELAFEIAGGLADPRALGWCHFHRGRLAEARARYPDALADFERALPLFRQTKDRRGEAAVLNALGVRCGQSGRYDEALGHFDDVLKMAREAGDRDGESIALGNLGQVYEHRGRYADARKHYQGALDLRRELDNRAGQAGALTGLGRVDHRTGNYAEALRQYQEALAIRRELGQRGAEAGSLLNLGVVHWDMGRYAEALRHLQESLRIAREIGDPAGEASALGDIGLVYWAVGRYAEALRYYQDNLRIDRRLGHRADEVNALNNLAGAYSALGRLAEALRHYQEGLRLVRELGNRAGEGHILANMGLAAEDAGQHAEALRYLQESLKMAQEAGDREGEGRARTGIAGVCHATGRHADALANYRAGLELAESAGAPRSALVAHLGLGDVYRDQNKWDEAAAAYRRAIDRVEGLRGAAEERSLQTSFLARHTAPYLRLALCLLELGRPEEAFATAEKAKARALIDVLQSGKADLRRGMSDDERRAEQRMQERLTALTVEGETLRSRKLNPRRQQEIDQELVGARQDFEAFRRDLYLRRPELQARRGEFTPAALDELNRSLFADQPKLVVLSYLVAEKETLLFVLTRGDRADGPARLAVHRIEAGKKELAEAVEQFRSACKRPGGGTPDGSELYRLLLAPAGEAVAAASQVVVLPDGPLHTLPFHALRDGEEGDYLVARCAVGYAPSATALLKMAGLARQRRKESAGGLLAAGVGDFGRREPALPQAEPEARAVAELFGEKATALVGAEATRANLRARWAGRRYLHLATHGRLNEDVPLYSAVVLARENDRDEGVLFGRDLLDEELAAELVVLSACETGLGRQTSGEGLLGLTWAWFVAGVPSTVASQWAVADDSTARLMRAFYTELKGGLPKAEALRRAQLALLKDKKTRHPFYWAPFALNGDPW